MMTSYILSMGLSSSLYEQYKENFKGIIVDEKGILNTQLIDFVMIERKVYYKEERDVRITIFCPKDKTFESYITPTNMKITETKAKSFEDLLGEIDLAVIEYFKKKDHV